MLLPTPMCQAKAVHSSPEANKQGNYDRLGKRGSVPLECCSLILPARDRQIPRFD
jgi:hypothetical protein